MKKRIIHIIDSLCIGGGQALLFELYIAIKKYYGNVSQTIILTNPKKVNEKYLDSYGMKCVGVRTACLPRYLSKFKEPMVIICHKLMSSNLQSFSHLYKQIPIIVVNHTYTINSAYNKIKYCDYIVLVSEHMKPFVTHNTPQRGICVIRNGINAFRYENIEPKDKVYDENVLITGRNNGFNRIKYSSSWIKWCLSVELPNPMVHEYIGDGVYRTKAKQLVRKLAGSRNKIKLIGLVEKFSKKIQIIKSWDLFLYEVNRAEGISISVLEALACGVPVICSNHSGNRDIIEKGVNGYVFSTRKQAKKILTDLCLNKDKLKKLKETTLEHFRTNLDAKFMADSYMSLVNKLPDIVYIGVRKKKPHRRPPKVVPIDRNPYTKRRITKTKKYKLRQTLVTHKKKRKKDK